MSEIITTNLKETIWARVRSECADQIRACFQAIAAHQSILDELTSRSLLPGQALTVLKHLEENRLENPTPDRLLSHANIMANLKAIVSNPSVSDEARRQANAKFMEIEPFIAAMEKAVESSLDRQISELQAAESEFLSRYGLPHEETAVSRIAVALKGQVSNHGYAGGLRQAESFIGDYVPRVNTTSFEPLFRGLGLN
jgi:hypothetical protein